MFGMIRWDRSPWSLFDELESLQEDMNRALSGYGWDQSLNSGLKWHLCCRFSLPFSEWAVFRSN